MTSILAMDPSDLGVAEVRSEILLSKNEGRAAGESVVQCLNSARFTIIEAAVLIRNSIDQFRKNRDALDGFLDVLVEGGALAKSDAQLGEHASKLSVYRKVGEHANLLSNLCHYFDPSLYIYYDVVRLFEALNRDERAIEQQLKAMALFGVSRESLQQAIRDLKSSKHPPAEVPVVPEITPPGGTNALPPTGEFGLILATPSASDIRLLARDMIDSAVGIPKCMRVHEWAANTAVLLVTSRIIDLPVVVHRLLPYCGFSGASHIFRLDGSAEHEITGCPVLTVSSRGEYPIEAAKLAEGLANGLSPFDIAADWATEDDGRLHVFANEAPAGWTSIVGSDNWSVAGDAP